MGLIVAERIDSWQSAVQSRDNGDVAIVQPVDRTEYWRGCAKGLCASRHPDYRGMRPRTWRRRSCWCCTKNIRALDRVEDLLPLSLEIARFKIWAARRKIVRRGEDTSASRSTICRWRALRPILSSRPRAASGWTRLESALRELGERCRELFRLKLEGYTFPGDSEAAESRDR